MPMSMRLLQHINIPENLQLYSTLFYLPDKICKGFECRLKS